MKRLISLILLILLITTVSAVTQEEINNEVQKVTEDIILADINDVDFIKVNPNLGYDRAKELILDDIEMVEDGGIIQQSNMLSAEKRVELKLMLQEKLRQLNKEDPELSFVFGDLETWMIIFVLIFAIFIMYNSIMHKRHKTASKDTPMEKKLESLKKLMRQKFDLIEEIRRNGSYENVHKQAKVKEKAVNMLRKALKELNKTNDDIVNMISNITNTVRLLSSKEKETVKLTKEREKELNAFWKRNVDYLAEHNQTKRLVAKYGDTLKGALKHDLAELSAFERDHGELLKIKGLIRGGEGIKDFEDRHLQAEDEFKSRNVNFMIERMGTKEYEKLTHKLLDLYDRERTELKRITHEKILHMSKLMEKQESALKEIKKIKFAPIKLRKKKKDQGLPTDSSQLKEIWKAEGGIKGFNKKWEESWKSAYEIALELDKLDDIMNFVKLIIEYGEGLGFKEIEIENDLSWLKDVVMGIKARKTEIEEELASS